jgi:tetratricopeptide (TPR) repeat protein
MKYITHVRKIYDSILSTKFKQVLIGTTQNFDELNKKLQKKFELNELRNSYTSVLSKAVDQYLPFFKDDFHAFLKIREVSFYYYNISSSTASHLFWIWNNNLELSNEALTDFVDSFFLGVFGYKMIDFQNDNRNSNPELSFVGLYAIKIAEQLLEKILGKEITSPVYLKYAKMYTEIEYLEKKNRWKPSIFSWNESRILGYKASPTYIVYESLFRYAGYQEKKIRELIEGLIHLSAGLQLIDDLADAKQDLANGYETLVMKGYFERFGISSVVTDEKVNEILTQDRLKLIYQTGQELFDKARWATEKHDDYILQLLIEIQNLNFTTLFEIK